MTLVNLAQLKRRQAKVKLSNENYEKKEKYEKTNEKDGKNKEQ